MPHALNPFALSAALPLAVRLAVCGLANALIFYLAFGERYSLAKHGEKIYQTIGTLNRFSPEGALLYAAGFAIPFGLYWFGWRAVIRRARPDERRAMWLVLVAFAAAMIAALLPMYSTDATDIYDYIIRGRMTAVYGLNPLRDVPGAVSSDPFYEFVGWKQVPSAYGGAWEILAALASRIAGDDKTANVMAFKLLSVVGYALTALFIGLTLSRVAPRRALLGVYLFAWNPLVLYMVGGRGHNDSLLTACMLLAVLCLVRRWYVAATLGALLGALIKFIPLLLIPIIAVVALRHLSRRLWLRYLVGSAALGGVLIALCYGPFWFGPDTLRAERRAQMYTGSVATIIRQTLAPTLDNKSGETWTQDTPNVNALLSNGTLALMALFYGMQTWRVFRSYNPDNPNADALLPVRAAALILMFYLLVAALWFQSWYVLWPLALVALLDDTPLRRFVLFFSYVVTWQTLIYAYVTLRPGQFAPLPWRDLAPVAAYMLTAWGLVAWYWGAIWWRRSQRTAHNLAIGHRLRAARELAGLSPAALADELNLATDDVVAYERGEKPIQLDTLEALCARLSLSLPDVVSAAWLKPPPEARGVSAKPVKLASLKESRRDQRGR